MNSNRMARFALVNAAHRFLTRALPPREPESQEALKTFVQDVSVCTLQAVEVEAFLLRCLAVYDRHTGGRLPGLVDKYLAAGWRPSDALARFSQCVKEVLKYRGVGDPVVQSAIATIEDRYSDSHLRQGSVATTLRVRPAELASRFKRQTNLTFREYLREVRLNRAAALLAGGATRIKDVWVAVGYNHPSNFDHDFKSRFGSPPRQYRSLGTVMAAMPCDQLPERSAPTETAREADDQNGSVLIIDDDEGTRETIGRYLQFEGYRVFVASTGSEGFWHVSRTALNVVLLDYHLPDMDGITWLRCLRTQRVHTTPEVILFTADVEVERNQSEVLELGATVASKLCELEDIRRLVATCRGETSLTLTSVLRTP